MNKVGEIAGRAWRVMRQQIESSWVIVDLMPSSQRMMKAATSPSLSQRDGLCGRRVARAPPVEMPRGPQR